MTTMTTTAKAATTAATMIGHARAWEAGTFFSPFFLTFSLIPMKATGYYTACMLTVTTMGTTATATMGATWGQCP
jgi:hypothetical protein